MIDLVTATRIAEEYIDQQITRGGLKLKLLREQTIERDFGWTFFYTAEDESVLLAGNAPFIVHRDDGSIHVTGTAYPTETYLEIYAVTGQTNPAVAPLYFVTLVGYNPGLLKISLTKAIRGIRGKGRADAKHYTDSVLAGKAMTLVFPTEAEADKFYQDVQQIGALARRETPCRH
jgi:hypothetical protein